jgi:hypothetical protein
MLSSIGGRSDDVCALMKGRRDDRRLDLSNKMNAEAEIDGDTNLKHHDQSFQRVGAISLCTG